jgi:glycosyltransferase involved in cell wall biosynthesis
MNKTSISFVIPLKNEEENVIPLYNEIISVVNHLTQDFEIIFVDDGSADNSYSVLKQIQKQDSRHVKIIKHRRNFGKARALANGFALASKEVVFTMDADLQDDPAEIPNFLEKLEEGYDLVSGWKQKRKDPLYKLISTKIFNWLVSKSSKIYLNDFNCGYKAMKLVVAKSLNLYGDLHRFLPVLAARMGFRVGQIKVHHRARVAGKSKYGLRLNGIFDILNIFFITNFSSKPLHFFGIIGTLLFLVGMLINGYLTFIWFMGEAIGHRPLLMLGVLLTVIGVQTIMSGLIAEMLVRRESNSDHSFEVEEIIEK